MNKENQQVTKDNLSNNENLAYLAGIIDGEGSLLITKTLSHNRYCYTSRLQIPNTNEGIINKICEVLDFWNINGHIETRDRNKKHKICYVITINGVNKLIKLLPIIIPYLFGKREQAKLLLRFCKSRLKNQSKKTELIHNLDGTIKRAIRKDGYIKEEISLYEQLVLLNKKGR